MKISEYKEQDSEEIARYNTIKSLFEQTRSALDFVVHYAKCLELQHSTNVRLHRLVPSIVPTPRDDLSNLLNSGSSQLSDMSILKVVLEQAMSGLEECGRIKELKQDFKTKSNDFILATNNFDVVLNNLQVVNSQLRKIETQYDDIYFSYRQSRTALEHEMTKTTAR